MLTTKQLENTSISSNSQQVAQNIGEGKPGVQQNTGRKTPPPLPVRKNSAISH